MISFEHSSPQPYEKPERSALISALEALQQRIKREKRRKLFTLYPDDGPLRRELYPKHLEFFAGGKDHMERCMMAANRVGKCVRGSTVIETVDGERTAEELWARGQSFRVWAWDGSGKTQTVACAPFKKARRHQCYRVTMTDGRWFEAADLHRVLTCGGWRYLDELHQGFVSGLPGSNAVRAQSVHAANERRLLETVRGLMDRCSEGFHQYGAQLRGALEIDQAWSPSLACALPRSAVSWSSDDLANTRTSSPSLACDLLSSLGVGLHSSAQFVGSQDRIGSTTFGWLFGSSRDGEQLLPGLASRPQSSDERAQCEDDIQLVPFAETPIVDGSRISSIHSVGRHEVYDFHVPQYENYVTAGVVHHNTWGVGGYETALHLTGLYPDWWPGRRWDRPISAWAAGDTRATTRDIIQQAMLGIGAEGKSGELGTGLIPGECIIGEPSSMQGTPGGVETVTVQHKSGGRSILQFKSYDQGRRTFQGTKKDLGWFDEEPPIDVYEEMLLRLTATVPGEDSGSMINTFTPLLGLSKVALKFLPHLAPQ